MGYVSKVKLPSGNIYQIKDKEGRVIFGFSDWQPSHAYVAGEYVLTTATGAGLPVDGERKLFKVVTNYTSSASSKTDVSNGKLVETSVEEELQAAMAGGVGVVHTTGDESIGGTKTFTANNTNIKNIIIGSGGEGYIANSATGGARIEFSLGSLSFKTDSGSNVFTATLPTKTGTIALTSDIPTAGTTATKVGTTSSGGSATTWSKSDHTHGIDLATGDSNGQVKIAGQNVSVKGLGSAAYTNSTAYIAASQKGAANGVATLDENSKITSSQLPDYILGQLKYCGTVLCSAINGTAVAANLSELGYNLFKDYISSAIPTVPSWSEVATALANLGEKSVGCYFIVVDAQGTVITEVDVSFPIGTDQNTHKVSTGDWIVYNGFEDNHFIIDKIDNSDAVKSVNGKTGVVTIGTNTTKLSVGLSGGSVTLNNGTAITYGQADVGTAVNVGTSLTGTTSFNTDGIKSATCSQSFLTAGLASASLGSEKTFAKSGVTMSIDSTDTEMLVFSSAGTGTVTLSTTPATATAVSITTAPATSASVTLGTTSITPAKAATRTFTPKTSATLNAPSATISSGTSGDVTVVTGLN